MGLSMKDKQTLTNELAKRYRSGSKKEKKQILDEFVKTTEYNRKYAIHLLANWGKKKRRWVNGKLLIIEIGKSKGKRKGRLIYDKPVIDALKRIWKYFDYMCGKRLAVLIRQNIELLTCQDELKIDKATKE